MKGKTFVVTAMLFALLLLIFNQFLIAGELPKLPGITVKDPYPNGCVSCHVQKGGKDYRLPVLLSKIEGHPKIDKIVKTAPNDCSKCHKKGTKAGLINLAIHRMHFQNPKENHFIAIYKGNCLSCHKLNLQTYEMEMKSGKANW